MLFSLSVKNFKKSLRDYSIYFFTMILGISVFYIFNAIETQTAMMDVNQIKAAIVSTMNGVLEGVSVFVSLVLGYLIVYASRFMLKKRKKEFGVYLTLGMGRVRLAGILWLETIWMGLISLAVGLVLGVGLSQLMSLAVSNLFQADVSHYVFTFSPKAAAKSVGYFLVIYLVVMVFDTVAVSRTRLVDFIHAGKKKERNFLKKPWLCGLVFLAAVFILGTAYYNVTANQDALATEMDVLTQVILGIIGTFLIFWSLSGFFMAAAGRLHRTYYKGLNSFVCGEISNRLNSTVMALSVICLLVFMTICLLFSAIARKDYKDKQALKLAPVSISMSKILEGETDRDIEAVFREQQVDTDIFEKLCSVYTYKKEGVTNAAVTGYTHGAEDYYGKLFDEENVEMMGVEEYNRAARVYGLPTYSLKEDEYLVVANQESAVSRFNRGLSQGKTIEIQGKTYRPAKSSCQEGYLMMNYDFYNMGILLVPDSVEFQKEERYSNYVIADYRDKSKAFCQKMDQEFSYQLNPQDSSGEPVHVSTQSRIFDDTIGSSAMYIFLGLYLGICFLISGAAVLALKILSDSADSREKYMILQKLGCSHREIRKALRRQNSILFLLPLLLALIHSLFGIQVCKEILAIYGTQGDALALSITAGLVVFIYGGYFLLAHWGSVKIVRE